MNRVLSLVLLIGTFAPSLQAKAVDECSLLIWQAFGDDETRDLLYNRSNVSIFRIFSGLVEDGEDIFLDGAVVEYYGKAYLTPPGSESYVLSHANRIELRFVTEVNPPPDFQYGRPRSLYHIAGRIERHQGQWILSDSIMVVEVADRPEHCVSDTN